ncbi:MAG: UDP-N-acetylmuramoyl-L-alanyl-D-glutamate--2,6-diaminopimelate ligase [Fusobacteriaceae bacterium]
MEKFFLDIKKYKNLHYDSRKITPGDVFVALEGSSVDGHNYIDIAIKNGATGVLISKEVEKKNGVEYYLVENLRKNLGEIASEFYGYPQNKIKIIGITGTNGKTTTTYLLESILGSDKVSRIGTVEYKIGKEIIDAPNTTPESLDIIKMCKASVERGMEYLVMEVSSHALMLGRVDMLKFDVAIFSNLTPEHLDFHKNMEEYFNAKKELFLKLKKNGIAVINLDDKSGERYFKEFEGISYGLNSGELRAEYVPNKIDEIIVHYGEKKSKNIKINLLGKYNLYNLLSAIGGALAVNKDFYNILEKIKNTKTAPGRFETINCKQDFLALVDYAHTEDALENLLKTVEEIKKSRIITVFGCGGDRDKTKRAKMAKVAEKYSDIVILTADNPRTESLVEIISDSEKGFTKKNHLVEIDREKAIKKAIDLVCKNDIVVVAGKGHETYQIIGKTKFHFDDKEILCREILKKMEVKNDSN